MFDKEPLCLHVCQGLVCVLFQVGIGKRIFYFDASIFPIEVNVHDLLENSNQKLEIQRIAELAENNIKNGTDVVIYTSRKLIDGLDSGAIEESQTIEGFYL